MMESARALREVIERMQLHNQRRHLTLRKRGCSSAGRAPALHAGGQEFDPPHLHQRVKVDEEDREKAETKWAHSSGG